MVRPHRQPRALGRALLAIVTLVGTTALASSTPGVVRAAALPTTTTLDAFTSPVYPEAVETYSAHVSPIPEIGSLVDFEYSSNGVDWQTISVDMTNASGVATDSASRGPSQTKGTRQVRAHFMGSVGFVESISTAANQVMARFRTVINTFRAVNPNVGEIRPETSPVRLELNVTNKSGTMIFEERTTGGWTALGSTPLSPFWTTGDVLFESPALGEGARVIRVTIPENDYVTGVSEEFLVQIARAEPNLSISVLGAVPQANRPTTLVAWIGASIGDLIPSKPITVKNAVTGQVVATTSWLGGLQFTLPAMAAGTITLQSSYPGDANILPGVSPKFVVTIAADTVEATGVGLNRSTFYPYKDGFKDDVAIIGMRNEPISVAIRIYSPAGSPVRSASMPLGTGRYTYGWNGRTSTGTILAGGAYKVVQVLRDAAGTQHTFTSYVTLSRKRIYTYTTYVTRTVAQAAKRTQSWVGWQFTLPAATIYKTMWFQVYGRSTLIPGVEIGAYDFHICGISTNWSPNCVIYWGGLGWTNAWHSKGISTTWNRSGRYVRGVAAAMGSGVVYGARVKVVYGILK